MLSAISTILTFPGDVSTNPDLQYFKAGDVVGARVVQMPDYLSVLLRVRYQTVSGSTATTDSKWICAKFHAVRTFAFSDNLTAYTYTKKNGAASKFC